MPNEKPVLSFQFQEIPLNEAVNAIMAGDGNYADVKAYLLEALPKIEQRNLEAEQKQTLCFGLPNAKELPEDQRRALCLAINATLKKASLSWRLTYSSIKKVFICAPRAIRSTYIKQTKIENTGDVEKFVKNALNLLNPDNTPGTIKRARKAISVVGIKDLGMSPKQIAPLLGITGGGVYFNATKPGKFGKEEIQKLREAVKKGM